MEFTEKFQLFTFDDNHWIGLKYDEETAFTSRMRRLEETKAVDFVGIHNGSLFLIEMKDFREYRVENQPRLTEGELAIEIGQKVRDTIAGIVGAYRMGDQQKWKEFAKALADPDKTIRVVIWVEYDLPSHSIGRRKVQASVESNVFKQKLNWLTSHVLVSNHLKNEVPDMVVRNLPYP